MLKSTPPQATPLKAATTTAKNSGCTDEEALAISNRIKSKIRNTLLASPDFAKLYADHIISEFPNSNAAKLLAANYQKILDRISMQTSNVKNCTHIKVNGVRCGSPALRGEQFCYFHQRVHRGVRTPPQARLHPIALIEDEESIQYALMEVINAFMRNTIDLKRAALILRALHIAVKNANRVRFDQFTSHKIKDVPEYPEPSMDRNAAPPTELDLPFEAALAAEPHVPRTHRRYQTAQQSAQEKADLIANYYGYPNAEAQAAAKNKAATNPAVTTQSAQNNVRADALVRPGGAAAVKPPAPATRAVETCGALPRKPSSSVKQPATPQERKNVPHRASAG